MLNAFQSTPGESDNDWSDRDPQHLFERLIASFYEPFEDEKQRNAADVELFQVIKKARIADEAALRRLLRELRGGPLFEHRARVVDAVLRAFEDIDALYPALWVEAIEGRAELSDFRVMRDDFPSRKSLYQDVFELASRSLALIAPIANIANRTDLRLYCDGERRNTNRALKETAFKRERWLDEFPEAKKLYAPMARHTRNDFGHALARYDEVRDMLVFDDGREQSYLHFLIDQLAAVRLSHYLLDVIYILELSELELSK